MRALACVKALAHKDLTVLVNAVLPGILLLGLVIFVHELGHFLMAKWRGVRVICFSMGFGPALWSFTRGETEYRLSWIPLGGYVQMAGDSVGEDGELPGGPDEFLSHPWFGRILIAAAGPAANLITATIVMILVGLIGVSIPDFPNRLGSVADTSAAYAHGLRSNDAIVGVNGTPVASWVPIFVTNSKIPNDRPIELTVERGSRRETLVIPAGEREPVFSGLRRPPTLPVVGAVITGMPAYKAGLKEGDRVTAVNGKEIHTWEELPPSLRGTVDQKVHLRVERGGRTFDIDVVPMSAEAGGDNARIGIEPPREGAYVQRSGLLESVDMGVRYTGALVANVYGGMWLTISRPLYYREYIGGPLFIAQASSEAARRGIDSYLQFLAMINIAIMAFNLMPLPILDGGHILLALIEAVRRQAISARTYVRFQQFGLVIMGTLLVLILANDPWRVVQRQRAIGKATPRVESPPVPAPQNPAPEEKTVAPTPP